MEYWSNLAANAVLNRTVESTMRRRPTASKAPVRPNISTANAVSTQKTWNWKRRIIYKAEVVRAEGKRPKDNPRFVVTNLKQSPHGFTSKSTVNGGLENRIKELHYGMEIGRTSCTELLGQSVPSMMTAAAYVLMQELRLAWRARIAPGRKSQFCGSVS